MKFLSDTQIIIDALYALLRRARRRAFLPTSALDDASAISKPLSLNTTSSSRQGMKHFASSADAVAISAMGYDSALPQINVYRICITRSPYFPDSASRTIFYLPRYPFLLFT